MSVVCVIMWNQNPMDFLEDDPNFNHKFGGITYKENPTCLLVRRENPHEF